MKTIFVATNGYPRSGKDSFCQFCLECVKQKNDTGDIYSTITTCMKVAKIMGWGGDKDRISRAMLSELKDVYTKYFDGTFYEMVSLIQVSQELPIDKYNIIFAMIREPDEIRKIKAYCDNNNIFFQSLLLTHRGERNHTSHSDKNVENFDYDTTLANGDSIKALEERAIEYVNSLYRKYDEFVSIKQSKVA